MMQKNLNNKKNTFSLFLLMSLFVSIPVADATDLNQQLEYLAKKLASAAQGDVVKGSETQVYISLGQLQGILPGNKFEIVRQGEPLKVGDEIIGYEETSVAKVEVERARDKVSICKVLEKSDIPQSGDKAYQVRKKINTLVVGQFSYNQGFNRLTKSLQEKLVTSMANRGMQVVERDQLERVLKEQKLGYSGLVNMGSAKKIGELLGAEGMLLGTISDMGNSITINARMVDMESGKAVSASAVELAKTPLVAQLLDMPIEMANDSNVVKASSRSGTDKKKNNKQQAKEAEDFSFLLKECKKSGQTVTCHFLVTNNGEDRELTIFSFHPLDPKSKLFDNLGNSYLADRVQLANCSNRKYSCRMKLISGVSTSAAITINGVADEAQSAAVIELLARQKDNFSVQFRNVQFTK